MAVTSATLLLRLSPALLCFAGMLSRHFNTCKRILCVWGQCVARYHVQRMAMDMTTYTVDVHA